MDLIGWILLGGGIFSVLGSALDWDFFFESRKAKFMVGLIGRMAARVFYGVLGLALSIWGLLIVIGVLES